MSERQKGLRARLDEATEKRREEAKALPEIRREIEGLSDKVETIQEALDEIEGDLGVTKASLKTAAKRGVRVAKTMQARGGDLETIEAAGEEAEKARKAIKGLRWRGRVELVAWLTAALILTILILWSTAGLSPYVLPQEWRMSEQERADLRELSRIRQATENMSEEDLETYKELMNENLEGGKRSPSE